jgi:hypothetical protein
MQEGAKKMAVHRHSTAAVGPSLAMQTFIDKSFAIHKRTLKWHSTLRKTAIHCHFCRSRDGSEIFGCSLKAWSMGQRVFVFRVRAV